MTPLAYMLLLYSSDSTFLMNIDPGSFVQHIGRDNEKGKLKVANCVAMF